MSGAKEAFERVGDAEVFKDAGWSPNDISIVHYEWTLPDGTDCCYLPRDRRGQPITTLKAKRSGLRSRRGVDPGSSIR